MRWLDRVPLLWLALIAVWLALAPLLPEPHVGVLGLSRCGRGQNWPGGRAGIGIEGSAGRRMVCGQNGRRMRWFARLLAQNAQRVGGVQRGFLEARLRAAYGLGGVPAKANGVL